MAIPSLAAGVSARMGGYFAGTTTANGTAAALIDSNLAGMAPDGVKGYTVRIGTLCRLIDRVDVSLGQINVCPNWPNANTTVANTAYEVFSVTPNEINNAIAQAVLRAGRDVLAPKFNELIAMAALNNEAILPADCVSVLLVERRDTQASNPPIWRAVNAYEVLGNMGQRKIVLPEFVGIPTMLRVAYAAAVGFDGSGAMLVDGATNYDVDARAVDDFLIEQACAFLHQARAQMNPSSDAARMHVTMMRQCQGNADVLRQRFNVGVVSQRAIRAAIPKQF